MHYMENDFYSFQMIRVVQIYSLFLVLDSILGKIESLHDRVLIKTRSSILFTIVRNTE